MPRDIANTQLERYRSCHDSIIEPCTDLQQPTQRRLGGGAAESAEVHELTSEAVTGAVGPGGGAPGPAAASSYQALPSAATAARGVTQSEQCV